jgi:hypothetical protein
MLAAAAALLLAAPAQAEVVHVTSPVDLAGADPYVEPVFELDPTGRSGELYRSAGDAAEDMNDSCFGHEVPSNHPTDVEIDGGHFKAFVNTESVPDVGDPFDDGSGNDPVIVGVGAYFARCGAIYSPDLACDILVAVIHGALGELQTTALPPNLISGQPLPDPLPREVRAFVDGAIPGPEDDDPCAVTMEVVVGNLPYPEGDLSVRRLLGLP